MQAQWGHRYIRATTEDKDSNLHNLRGVENLYFVPVITLVYKWINLMNVSCCNLNIWVLCNRDQWKSRFWYSRFTWMQPRQKLRVAWDLFLFLLLLFFFRGGTQYVIFHWDPRIITSPDRRAPEGVCVCVCNSPSVLLAQYYYKPLKCLQGSSYLYLQTARVCS